MRPKIHPDAPARLLELSSGRFSLVDDAHGIAVVDSTSGQRIQLLQFESPSANGFAAVKSLSRREQETLRLIADGVDMQTIATRMGVSVKTVETYRARMKDKLGIDNGLQLIKFAVEWKVHCFDLDGAVN